MLGYPTYTAPGEEDWTWYQHLAYGIPGVGPSIQYLDTGHRGSFVPLDYTSWLTTYFWATAPLGVMALKGMSAYEIGGTLHKTGTILRFAGSPAGVATAAVVLPLAAHTHTMTSDPPHEYESNPTSWWRGIAQAIGAGGFSVGGYQY